MNLESVDMEKEFKYYNEVAPMQNANILGEEFKYRYFKNPNPVVNVTIVMLAGGTGLGDGFFGFAKYFMDRYSLINFNYPIAFSDNEKTADAIAELIQYLKAENVYLWGQSYGGVLAQIIAKRHPDVVKGLLLSSTASMSNDIQFEGMQCLVRMCNEEKEQKNIKTYKRFPMSLLPALMNLAFKKHLKGNSDAQKAIKQLMKILKPDMTKEYFCHMTHLLGDLRNYLGTHCKEDFEYLRGHVLIIEPDDDKTFTDDIKDTLVRIMPEPEVVRDIPGGHLATMFDIDGFMKIMNDFMDRQTIQ